MLFGTIGAIICVVLWGRGILCSLQKTNLSREQLSPFECGFDTKQVGRTPFSLHYFTFVLLFLLFDIEVVFFFHFSCVEGWGFYTQIVFC